MTLPARLSYVKLQNAQDIESAELVLNGGRHLIPKRRRGTFSGEFDEPLTFAMEQLSLFVGRKKSRFGFSSQTVFESISISSAGIFSTLQRQRVQKKVNKVSFTIGILSVTFGVSWQTKPAARTQQILSSEQDISTNTNAADLRPTIEGLIKQCPRFRILVIGESDVGRVTLINRVFGVENAYITGGPSWRTDVEIELTSPQNDRLAVHMLTVHEDYDEVEPFIEQKECMPDVKDQLHAVWLCFRAPIPTYGAWLLDEDAEQFLQAGKEILGNIPTIVVFTKYDQVVRYLGKRDPAAERRYLQEHCIQPIQNFTRDWDISYVAVSSKPSYEQGLRKLMGLTQRRVYERFSSPGNSASAVALALADAQQMVPISKVDLSIDVRKQRYRRTLGTGASFPGYTMQDCLTVIHTDVVLSWGFYDPCEYLNSEEFRKAMMDMVERVDAPSESTHHPSRSGALSGTSRGAIPPVVPAPVILPLNAIVMIDKLFHETHQRLRGVRAKFMTYIVDFIHVLEILFSLTADMKEKQLTRTTIQLAYKAYNESEWMRHTHMDIRSFQCSSTARGTVFEKITTMISSDDSRVRVPSVLGRMPLVDLEKDEEWMIS